MWAAPLTIEQAGDGPARPPRPRSPVAFNCKSLRREEELTDYAIFGNLHRRLRAIKGIQAE